MFVADENEAPIRRRIFALFAEHQRKKVVAEILNAEGHRTRNDAIFTTQTISRLLTEEAVTGIDGEVEALISHELWEQCQSILEAQKISGGAKRSVSHLFSGFLHCTCGQKMYVPTNGKKYVCPDCRNKIATDDMERIFWSQMKTYALPGAVSTSPLNLHDHWPTLSFKNKREVVEAVTKRIEVADKKVTCFLYSL